MTFKADQFMDLTLVDSPETKAQRKLRENGGDRADTQGARSLGGEPEAGKGRLDIGNCAFEGAYSFASRFEERTGPTPRSSWAQLMASRVGSPIFAES
jgi:hypothetical protein